MAKDSEPDWSRIPTALTFIIEPAKRYGHLQFEEQVEAFEASATEDERAELKRLAERLWDECDCADGHALVLG